MNQKSQKNLRPPFKKGCAPGPGRPKGSISISAILKKLLRTQLYQENPFNGLKRNLSLIELISLHLLYKAVQGDMRAIKEIMDRVDGKVSQQMQIQEDLSHEEWLEFLKQKEQIYK